MTETTRRLGCHLWRVCEVVVPPTLLYLLVRQAWQNLSAQEAAILRDVLPAMAILACPMIILIASLAAAIWTAAKESRNINVR